MFFRNRCCGLGDQLLSLIGSMTLASVAGKALAVVWDSGPKKSHRSRWVFGAGDYDLSFFNFENLTLVQKPIGHEQKVRRPI